jgi:hypothetical protein
MGYGNQGFEPFFTKTTLIRAVLIKTALTVWSHFKQKRLKQF